MGEFSKAVQGSLLRINQIVLRKDVFSGRGLRFLPFYIILDILKTFEVLHRFIN